MSVANDYLAQLDAPEDRWNPGFAADLLESLSDTPAFLREAVLLGYASHAVMRFVIRFAAEQWPGTDEIDDANWLATAALARRQLAAEREAGIETAMGDLALAVLAWIDAHVEMMLELQVTGTPGTAWRETVAMAVLSAQGEGIAVGDRLELRLVADPEAGFNGKLIELRAGERWLTCAHRLPDGTIVPDDGTRRLAA